MSDDSYLDDKYFVDDHIYNCPFCKRRHVMYGVDLAWSFDWSGQKHCYVYIVSCKSCSKESMHLSFNNICRQAIGRGQNSFRDDVDIDEQIFYSVPTSYFAIDPRIPRLIRELISEAEGCIKMNYLTGASACTRKAIYELLVKEGHTEGPYDERIKALKNANSGIDAILFDVLSQIQDMTSEKVHEQSWDEWDSPHLKLMLETLKTVLHELYVVPDERKQQVSQVEKLREQIKTQSKTNEAPPHAGT